MPCEQCGQIVEIAGLSDHLATECDTSQDFRYEPPLGTVDYRGCPLCAQPLPADLEGRKRHLMQECPGNPRGAFASA